MRIRLLTCVALGIALVGSGDAVAADGDLYTGFDGDGTLLTDFGSGFGLDDPNDAVLDSSGRIVVVGQADGEAGVVRINPDGTLDSTFGGGDGKVILDSGATSGGERARAVEIDGDGKIVVLGDASLSGNTDLVVARLQENGDYDAGFDGPNAPGNGIFRLDFSTFDDAVDIESKGTKLVVGATQTNTEPMPSVTQLNSDGTPDSSFGGGSGTFTFAFPTTPGAGSYLFAIVVQPDGQTVVSGRRNGTSGFGLARVKSDGSGLDTAGFNSSGTPAGLIVAPAPAGHISGTGLDVQLDGSGDILVGGDSQAGSPGFDNDMAMARFTSAGALDATFGTAGQTTVNSAPDQDFGARIAFQPDGKIILGGGDETASPFVYEPMAARFSSGGILDSTFGTAGLATHPLGQDTRMDSAALYDPASGVVYLVGSTYTNPDTDVAIQALQAVPASMPTSLATDPAGPANDNNPKVKGTVDPGTTIVSVYGNASCTGSPLAAGTGALFGGAGIPTPVADNTTTSFYATATWPGGVSPCSTSFASYAESTPPPPDNQGSTPPPSSTAQAAPKKCKKGQKLKKGKCVKKKRKKRK